MLHIFNKVKRIFILLIVILLTGCEAEYNIEINNNINLKETINIIETKEEKFNEKNLLLYNRTPKEYLETNLKWPTVVYKSGEVNPYEPIKLENTYYYTKTDISNYKMLGVSYSFNHNQNKYNETELINKCFDIKYSKKNNVISLEANNFKCFDEYKLLDKVTINLKTTCDVKKENASLKEKNKYTWYLTREAKEKNINFEVECNEVKKENSNNILIIFAICYIELIIFIILVGLFLFKKNNKI